MKTYEELVKKYLTPEEQEMIEEMWDKNLASIEDRKGFCYDASEFLFELMLWEDTRQGLEFWLNVNDRINS
jgi:hypothetical protein